MNTVKGGMFPGTVPSRSVGPPLRPSRVTYVPAYSSSSSLNFSTFSIDRKGKFGALTAVMCTLGSKEWAKDENRGLLWNPLGKVLGSFGGRSVEYVLREQMAKQKYDGGSGGNSPGGGRGGGGSGDSDSSSNADFLNEVLQVLLATMGFLLMYTYIICGPELTRLGRDYVKYLNGGGQSVRLKKAMNWWSSLYNFLGIRKNEDDMWLEDRSQLV